MFKIFFKKKSSSLSLYNKIMKLSRNKYFYNRVCLSDTYQARIVLILFHVSFIIIKLKTDKNDKTKEFMQNLFDNTFLKIEENLREFGWGDVTVNKNMKIIIKKFYEILLNCEKYHLLNDEKKTNLLNNNFIFNKNVKKPNLVELIKYFDNYQNFCCDLSINSVIKGELNFKYF
jgi:hypothetical protein